MDFEILPTKGVGQIALSMTNAQVRSVLGSPDEEFVRSPATSYVEWIYDALGVIVIFDRQGRCAAIMLSRPCDAILQGTSLLHVGGSIAWTALRRLDSTAFVDEGSLTSRKLGVSVYAPDVEEEPNEPPQSVLVFRSDYFTVT